MNSSQASGEGAEAKPLGLGLIGCGQLGATHAKCVAEIGGAKWVAFADVHEPAAAALCKQFDGGYATTNIDKVLGDARIDAVYICTRHDSHADLAIAAAKAGKHILIEKPLALTMPACQAIAQAVDDAGVWLMPAFKLRYYPLVQKAKAFIPQPQVMVGQMMDSRWADDIWPQDPVQGGANVHSQGCHTTDLLRFFASSEPTQIWAAGGALSHPGHPCIDQCVASITFASGCIASWIQGDAALGQFTSKFFFELFGGGRSVQLYNRMKSATFFDGKDTWTEHRDDEEGFMLENREFLAALAQRRPPELSSGDGIQATRMVLAADAAIRSGQVQVL